MKILSGKNIFHENYHSLTLTKHYKNIFEWWNRDDIQEARINFCEKHAKKNNNKINEIVKIFNSVIKMNNLKYIEKLRSFFYEDIRIQRILKF